MARSQEVSDAIAQQWQAAPCRKSSGSRGVRVAQIGSDEHRRARFSAAFNTPASRPGSLSWTRPPRVPSLSDAVVQISRPAAASRADVAAQAYSRSLRLAAEYPHCIAISRIRRCARV